MKKYGEFGISFSKPFLVSQGASPVFYVSSRSTVNDGRRSRVTLADHFDQRTSIYQQLAEEAVRPDWPDLTLQDGASLRNHALLLQEFIDYHFLSFVKFFDPSHLDDDQENYYMEREWRVFGNVEFGLADVARLTVPRAYQSKLKDDLPDYSGAVFVAEDAT